MAHLAKQFFDRTTDRRYQAIVWGDVADDEGTIVAHTGSKSQRNQKDYSRPFPMGVTASMP